MADPRHTILVIDDEPDWRETLGGMLKDEGYTILEAGTIKEALAQLEQHSVDVALIDLSLDRTDDLNTDGLDLAKQIQQNWPQVKSIIVTGHDTNKTVDEAMQPDKNERRLVETYVAKVDSDQLVEIVDKYLA